MRNFVVKLVFSLGSFIAGSEAFPLENDSLSLKNTNTNMAKRFQILKLLDPYGQALPTKSYSDSVHMELADLGRPNALLNFERRKSGNNNKYLKKFLSAGVDEDEVGTRWLKKLLRLHSRSMDDPFDTPIESPVEYLQKRKLSSENQKVNLFDFGAFKNMMGKGNEQNFLNNGDAPITDVDLKSFWDWLATDHGDSEEH